MKSLHSTLIATVLLAVVTACPSSAQTDRTTVGPKRPAVVPLGRLPGEASKTGAGKSAASIVARVDDQVILLEDVMTPVAARLRQAKEKLGPEQYRQFEWETLRQVTDARVQRAVVLKELSNRLPSPDILKRVRKGANEDFEKYLMQLAREQGLKTREEIVAQIKKEGANLEDLRNDFIDNLIAQQYVAQMIRPLIKEPTRIDLMSYYEDHRDEFREEKGAVWRHIEIKKQPDANAAFDKAQTIAQQLRGGADFAALAKKESQGSTAAAGGLWSLTSKGSYADPAVDQAIFSVPVGQASEVIDGKDSYHIVRVEKRSDGGVKPFAEVQAEIKTALQRQSMSELRKKKVDEMMTRHYIETIFDNPNQQAGRPEPPKK